ncbi:hypothetical protein LPJ61_005957 [Coemansia biformis]|uniref:Uncharacterized protein n=1 Tax=Coemansia biformis TaxID=1286918 RepID=A0A9W7Y1B2_9FUNG|nr:hypothetical protein LPJ61_005957 [Coemansia biformis]
MEIEDKRDWISSIKSVDECGGHKYARYAHLQLPFYAIVGGKLPELLSEYQRPFPMVTTVWLKIHKGAASGNVSELLDGAKEAIIEFKRTVSRLFPNATTFGVTSSIVFGRDESHMEPYAGRLFSEFLRGGEGIQYFSADNNIVDSGLATAATGLTHITYAECSSVQTFVELIRNNSPTLQSLYIEAIDPQLLARLVQLPNMDTVEYPELTRLTVGCADRMAVVGRSTLVGSPFPRLQHLSLTQAYPFTNDVVFRGNYQRLEHLSLHLDTSDILILNGYGTFAKGRFPNVNHMELSFVDQSFDKELAELAAAAQTIAPTVYVFLRKLEDAPLSLLRYLKITDLSLSMNNVLDILHWLPTLAQMVFEPEGAEGPDVCIADML